MYTIRDTPAHQNNPNRDIVHLTLDPLCYFIKAFTKFGEYQCNDSCDCNNKVALVERLAQNASAAGPQPFPPSSLLYERELRKTLKMFSRNFRDHTSKTPLTGYECMKAFRGRNQDIETQLGMLGFHTSVAAPRRYEEVYDYWKEQYAITDELDFTLNPSVNQFKKYSNVRPFAKVESISTAKWPRNISPRNPRFNFLWAQFTKPMESYFYKHLSATGSLSGVSTHVEPGIPNPWIGKSMNKKQRGDAVMYKISLFRKKYGVDPIVVPTDCTGLDAHITRGVIKEENRLYVDCFPSHREFLRDLTACFEENKFSGCGINGVVQGARMSGDMHTGLGNSLVVCAFNVTAFRMMGISSFDMLSDGDDCLLFIHPRDFARVEVELPQHYLGFGQELRLDKAAHHWSEIEWCQCKLVRAFVDGEECHIFVQNPHKVFATMGSHIHCRDNAAAEQYFGDVLYAFSVMYSFVPFFRELAALRKSVDTRQRRLQPGLANELIHNHKIHAQESPNTLDDYCRAFSLDPAIFVGHLAGDTDSLREALAMFRS